jgi:hypothetical protein
MRKPEPILRAALTATTLLLPLAANAADRVRCHVDYGGETRAIDAGPVASALTIAPVEIGSFFRFRLVLQRTRGLPDEVRIETFGDRDDGPVLIHQARYSAPLRHAGRRGGFTGHQTVYEPVRDGELQYWCEWNPTK